MMIVPGSTFIPVGAQQSVLRLHNLIMTPADMLTAVEAEHPAIATKIAAIWGEPECASYLLRLMIQDREGRAGFSEPVFGALSGLQELHGMLYPVQTATSPWELV